MPSSVEVNLHSILNLFSYITKSTEERLPIKFAYEFMSNVASVKIARLKTINSPFRQVFRNHSYLIMSE